MLRPSRRYAHSETYLRRLLSQHRFEVLSLEKAAIRMDRGEPVDGLIVVARLSLGSGELKAEELAHNPSSPRPASQPSGH